MSKPDPKRPETCIGRWIADTDPDLQGLAVLITKVDDEFVWVTDGAQVYQVRRSSWTRLTSDTERAMPAGWQPGDPIPPEEPAAAEVPELPEGWVRSGTGPGMVLSRPTKESAKHHAGQQYIIIDERGVAAGNYVSSADDYAPLADLKAAIAVWEAENG